MVALLNHIQYTDQLVLLINTPDHSVQLLLRFAVLSIVLNMQMYGQTCISARTLYTDFGRAIFIRGRNCLPVASTWIHPRFLVGSVLLMLLVFCVVLCCVVMLCLSSSCVLCSQCCPLLSIRDCPAAFSNVFEILLLNACLAAKTNLLVFDLTRPALIFTINRYFPTSIHVPLYIIKSININYSLIYYKRSVNMVQPCLYTTCGL